MKIRYIVLISLCTLSVSAAAFAVSAETDRIKTSAESASSQRVSPAPVEESSLDKEIRSLREQITAAPADTVLQVRLGYLLLKKGAPDEAQVVFAEALKLNPRSHSAMTGEGIIQAGKGDFKGAEKTLKAALVQNPNPVRTHYELGVVYEKLGEPEKALQEYKEGITKYQQGRK